MDNVVVLDQRWRVGAGELAERFLEGRGGNCWIKPLQCVAQPAFKDDLPVVAPLRARLIRRDLRAVPQFVAEALQPIQRGQLDDTLIHLTDLSPCTRLFLRDRDALWISQDVSASLSHQRS